MPTYVYSCSECNAVKEDFCTISKRKESLPCECGSRLERDFGREGPDKSNGDYELISQSLAINPCQTKVHRKLFPDVAVLPDGRIKFSSFRSHDKYLKQTGFHKNRQKRTHKGKIIVNL